MASKLKLLLSAYLEGPIGTWSLDGTGDFDLDGTTDLLWRDTSGNPALRLMNGAAVSSALLLGNAPLSGSVVGGGDFNVDGSSDNAKKRSLMARRRRRHRHVVHEWHDDLIDGGRRLRSDDAARAIGQRRVTVIGCPGAIPRRRKLL
jgi:hypothetical protein